MQNILYQIKRDMAVWKLGKLTMPETVEIGSVLIVNNCTYQLW